jgi:3-hydroxyacyl-[acyl-carrier-protein] dehydratase
MPPKALFDLTGVDMTRPIVTREQIAQVNPHRHEFALLDGFYHLDMQAQEMAAFVDVREDAFWVRGHIPGRPLMPGVLMIESSAQMISYFAKKATQTEGFIGFGGVTDVKFRGQVTPGMKLILLGKILELRARRTIGATQGFVNGTMVYEGTITGMLI